MAELRQRKPTTEKSSLSPSRTQVQADGRAAKRRKTHADSPCYLASKVLFWHGENCAQAPVPPTPHAVPHVVRQRYPAAPCTLLIIVAN